MASANEKQRALVQQLLEKMGLAEQRVQSLVIEFHPGALVTATVQLFPDAEALNDLLTFTYTVNARPDPRPPAFDAERVLESRFREIQRRLARGHNALADGIDRRGREMERRWRLWDLTQDVRLAEACAGIENLQERGLHLLAG